MRSKISAAVQRVDAVQLSADVGRLVVHWLGQLAETAVQRNGCAPDGLVEVQHAIAEAIATGGDSRRRESEPAVSPELLALAQEPVIELEDAAQMLVLKPDTVRGMCRDEILAAKKVGGRWFPLAAAVQQELRRRAGRSA